MHQTSNCNKISDCLCVASKFSHFRVINLESPYDFAVFKLPIANKKTPKKQKRFRGSSLDKFVCDVLLPGRKTVTANGSVQAILVKTTPPSPSSSCTDHLSRDDWATTQQLVFFFFGDGLVSMTNLFDRLVPKMTRNYQVIMVWEWLVQMEPAGWWWSLMIRFVERFKFNSTILF